jgi:hypothetical protein
VLTKHLLPGILPPAPQDENTPEDGEACKFPLFLVLLEQMSAWFKLNDRWPEPRREVLVKLAGWKVPRPAILRSDVPLPFWQVTDCIHPMQNCAFPLEDSEWLDS